MASERELRITSTIISICNSIHLFFLRPTNKRYHQDDPLNSYKIIVNIRLEWIIVTLKSSFFKLLDLKKEVPNFVTCVNALFH